MPHRAHRLPPRPAIALRESCIAERYDLQRFVRDLLAGVTVGIIAIPLAMALAIASGVPPQYGLYSAMIAGFVIALTGGSRYTVSGPTAAFVVILYPVSQQFGLAGLLVASLLAGVLMVAMALARLGRLIEYIPEAVTLGFTSGIAVVIATLQVRDCLGLPLATLPTSWTAKLVAIAGALPDLDEPTLAVSATTLGVLIAWPRLKLPVPGHLVALATGTLLAQLLSASGYQIDTIGSRFAYVLPDGSEGRGIPPMLPAFAWPWLQSGHAGEILDWWSWQLWRALLPAAFTIAMLGAIESLLCAVVLDGMSGRRHKANSELLGQGLGNIVAPFFGGITATAALARSAANFRAGAQTPVAAMVHALVVVVAVLVAAPLLSQLPMAALAAMLLMVAWNMSEAAKVLKLLRRAPTSDVLVLATCLSLTILFDMVIAIATGVLLACILFVRDLAAMTRLSEISENRRLIGTPLPTGWAAYRIMGPLFFAAADQVVAELRQQAGLRRGLLICLDAVPMLDAGGISALERLIEDCRRRGTRLILVEPQVQPIRALSRAGIGPVAGVLAFSSSLAEALEGLTGEDCATIRDAAAGPTAAPPQKA